MSDQCVLAAIDDSDAAGPVLATASRVASLYRASLRTVHVREDGAEIPLAAARRAGVHLDVLAGDPLSVLTGQASDPAVVAVVLGARRRPLGRRPAGSLAQALITTMATPLVLVPPDTPHPGRIDRVLVPLDGTPESAAALAGTIELARRSGLAVVVVHVQEETELPMFSDHLAHEPRAWAEEFIARNCPVPTEELELDLRVGVPHEEVLRLVEQSDVDLVALGWSQELAGGRAPVVRETLTGSTRPTLLVPLAGRDRGTRPEGAASSSRTST